MEWLRNRILRWLASGGNQVTLGIQGAYHVTVDAAGQVIINGSSVVAKNCQIRQDGTGLQILTDLEEPMREMTSIAAVTAEAKGAAPRQARQAKVKESDTVTLATLAASVAGRGSGEDVREPVMAKAPTAPSTDYLEHVLGRSATPLAGMGPGTIALVVQQPKEVPMTKNTVRVPAALAAPEPVRAKPVEPAQQRSDAFLSPAARLKQIVEIDRQSIQHSGDVQKEEAVAKVAAKSKAKPKPRSKATLATAGKNNGWAAHNSGNVDTREG